MGVRRAGPATCWPQLGFGAGLRAEHYDDVLAGGAGVEWFEAISENYMETGGRPLAVLESVRRDYPVALHGVSLSIGGSDPLDDDYLDALAVLVERIEPAIVSDHLCWSSLGGRQLFDLLPLPLTEEALEHVVSRVRQVQDRLGRRILLENPSTYVAWECTRIPEAEFLTELAERADCGLLLDVNNVHVTCTNMSLDSFAYIDAIAPHRVGQMHLAGFEQRDGYLFDTHSRPVSQEVWALYRYALERIGPCAAMVEWDADIPSWSRLVEEVDRARQVEPPRRRPEPRSSSLCTSVRAASPKLTELQQGLATLLLDRHDIGLERWLTVPAGVDLSTRLGVYSGGYPARLQEALVETFPAVAKILGDGSLASLVERYCPLVPTGWCNLNFVGRALPDFLRSDRLADELPFLPDLARLEWCVVECLHARVGDPFDLASAASWSLDDWARARISLQPGVGLVSSRWPIHELRAAREQERCEIDVDLVGRPQSVWVYRDEGFAVVTELLGEVEAGIAQGLLEGRALGDVMRQTEAEGADSGSPTDFFARIATIGLVSEVR